MTIGGVATADVSGQDGVPGAAGGGEEKAAFEGGGVSAGNGSWDRVVRLMRARFTRWGAGGAGAGGEVQWFNLGGLGGAACWAVEQRKVRLRLPERGTIPARGTMMGFPLISIDFLKGKKGESETAKRLGDHKLCLYPCQEPSIAGKQDVKTGKRVTFQSQTTKRGGHSYR